MKLERDVKVVERCPFSWQWVVGRISGTNEVRFDKALHRCTHKMHTTTIRKVSYMAVRHKSDPIYDYEFTTHCACNVL